MRAAAPREVRREEDVLEEAREEGEGEEFLFKWVLTSFQFLKAKYNFRGSTHPDGVLAGLNRLRKENTFTDVRIQVG